MNASAERTERRWGRTLLLISMIAVAAAVVGLWRDQNPSPSVGSALTPPVELLRTELVLTDGRLCPVGTSNAFTGVMVERYPDGGLRSRSAVANGLLNGLSEGWFTNKQLQVSEHFTNGVSHGLRVKWHANGLKAAEAQIVDGKLHGRFVSWHESGTKAAEVEFHQGQPDGISSAYFPSGALKSQVTMRDGAVIDRKDWKDGEFAQVNSIDASRDRMPSQNREARRD